MNKQASKLLQQASSKAKRPKTEQPVVIAVPRGRILAELLPLLKRINAEPEQAFFDDKERLMRFRTANSKIEVVRCRAFDVATFVAFGGVDMGVCGLDVLREFDPDETLAPLDLQIGKCRLSMAGKIAGKVAAAGAGKSTAGAKASSADIEQLSHIQVATKYPNLTTKYFNSRGIDVDCIKLNGALELAPQSGLCPYIVDLVSSGETLKANKLEEICTILEVSSQLIVNRTSLKLRPTQMRKVIEQIAAGVQKAKL